MENQRTDRLSSLVLPVFFWVCVYRRQLAFEASLVFILFYSMQSTVLQIKSLITCLSFSCCVAKLPESLGKNGHMASNGNTGVVICVTDHLSCI